MDKIELIEVLQKKGYDCQMEDNIPMITTADKNLSLDKLRIIMDDLDYHASFGLRLGKEKKEEIKQVSFTESEDGQISFL